MALEPARATRVEVKETVLTDFFARVIVMLQLQLLTKRNAPAPAETWGEDTAQVLAADFDAGNARRVQNVLKALLKR